MAGNVIGEVLEVNERSKVYKEECMYCFHGPETPGGIFICLKTHFGLCNRCIQIHVSKTGSTQFLRWQRRKLVVEKQPEEPGPEKKITKLAIGIEGGFQTEGPVEYIDRWTLVLFPDFEKELELNDGRIPPHVRVVLNAIIDCKGALYEKLLEAQAGIWDGEMRLNTKHVAFKLPDNPPQVGLSDWKCEWEGCGLENNLWLNLFDGTVFCGRTYHDAVAHKGISGNNHALTHYEQTGKQRPLVVKLGTINAETADVFSYDEDEMVIDPHLKTNLMHYAIDMTKLTKTDSSMAELELDMNLKAFQADRITESTAKLTPVWGPGYTPMINIGNSCYLASTVQTLCLIPDVMASFTKERAVKIFEEVRGDPAEDVKTQMCKLFQALTSGDYSPKVAEGDRVDPEVEALRGIKPYFFRHLIGYGHPEFSSKRQQDAAEYLMHLVEKMDAIAKREAKRSPADCFRFQIEEKFSVKGCNQVKYKNLESEVLLKLCIPMEAATNMKQVEEYRRKEEELKESGVKGNQDDVVLPRIPFDSILSAFREEHIDEFKSPDSDQNVGAVKKHSFVNFPKFLFIQAAKYIYGNDGEPKKLEVELEMPDKLDLEMLRAQGIQEGEIEMAGDAGVKKAKPVLNEDFIGELMSMGFSKDACEKAVYITGNSSLTAATAWVMDHMGDPDFNNPHPNMTAGASVGVDDNDNVAMLMAMGFTRPQAKHALQQNPDVNAAAEWLFSNPGFQVPEEKEQMDTTPMAGPQDDGIGEYTLVGMISHIGNSTSGGHYVCHLYKDDKWIIYNDEKVAISEHPPKQLAYVYLYRRNN